MTPKTLKNMLVALDEVYPKSTDNTARLFSIWQAVLEDISDTEGQAGLIRCLKEYQGSFRPTPAQFRTFCAGEDNMEGKADEAWASVLRALRRYGGWSSLDFEDSSVAEAIRRLGGWRRLCGSKETELGWMAKEFRAVYIGVGKVGCTYDSVVGVGATKLIPAPRREFIALEEHE
jgi:hypothetical protein